MRPARSCGSKAASRWESAEPAVDAVRTVYGDYDRDFIDAVESRWFELLKDRRNDAGMVKVEFNLHANGRITDMKLLSSDVDELQSLFCEQAVLGTGPFQTVAARSSGR